VSQTGDDSIFAAKRCSKPMYLSKICAVRKAHISVVQGGDKQFARLDINSNCYNNIPIQTCFKPDRLPW